jgi:transposase
MVVRAQRYREVQKLRSRGYTRAQIAAKLGISKSYVNDLLYDPTGEKCKARKDSYRGNCLECGRPTDGSNGAARAPAYCKKHANTAYFLYWTKSRIVAAIKEWAFIYGVPPVAPDWNRQVEGSPGQYVTGPRKGHSVRRWPSIAAVQDRFGSWANAIEAAGFPRPRRGHYRDESKRSEILTKYTADVIVEWIREHADGELPPIMHGAPVRSAIREFGSWANAVRTAGFEPRRSGQIARSTR